MVIKQKPTGWEYCVYLGLDEQGKKKYKRKSGFKTKKACEKAAIEVQNNDNIKPSYKTFDDICQLYLKDCEIRFLRKTTIYTYNSQINFFKKHFAQYHVDIKKINQQNIINFIIKCKSITQKSFTRLMITRLKIIFSFASKHKYIDKDIFININLPPIHRITKKIWSNKDLDNYLPLLTNFKYYDIIILLLETGLRRSELCGLTWDCVDLDRGIITINKSCVNIGKKCIINPPKTRSSIRSIILLQHSINIFKTLSVNKKSEYVFYDPKNYSKPLNPAKVCQAFKAFIKKNKMKYISLHDLRHIHATLLLNNNIDYKMLSKRLGHSNVAFTLQTYTHILPDHEIDKFKNMKIF